MTKITSEERFLDIRVRGKFGKAWMYGKKIFGKGGYGEEEICWDYFGYGFNKYGETRYGEANERWGIYHTRHELGKTYTTKMKFYIPSNPRTPAQQSWRQTFKDGMINWNNLTEEQQKEYNIKGSKLGLPGQNVFIKEYLNSQ